MRTTKAKSDRVCFGGKKQQYTLPRHWELLGAKVGNGPRLVKLLHGYVDLIPETLPTVADDLREGVRHEILSRLLETIELNCRRVKNQLER